MEQVVDFLWDREIPDAQNLDNLVNEIEQQLNDAFANRAVKLSIRFPMWVSVRGGEPREWLMDVQQALPENPVPISRLQRFRQRQVAQFIQQFRDMDGELGQAIVDRLGERVLGGFSEQGNW